MIDPYTAIGHFVVGLMKGAFAWLLFTLLFCLVRVACEKFRDRKKDKK